MEIQSSIGQIRTLINEAKKIVVLTHKSPNLDSTASLLAFGEILGKLNKDYLLVCEDPIPQECRFLKKSESIKQDLGTRNLMIGIKNGKEMVEKVSYYTQGEDFNLIITPRNQGVTAEQITYSFTGLEADLLVVLDTMHLNGLGSIYNTFIQDFKDLPLVNIDRHSQNARYGKINLIDGGYSSTAELLLTIADQFDIAWDAELATVFLAGLYGGSRNFMSQTTGIKSFQAGVKLLSRGADLRLILENLGPLFSKEDEKNNEEKSDENSVKINEENSPQIKQSQTEIREAQILDEDNNKQDDISQAKTNQENHQTENISKDNGNSAEDEYHLPTPSLNPPGDFEKDSTFADQKTYQSS